MSDDVNDFDTLDGTELAAVKLITGLDSEEIDSLGGVTEKQEPKPRGRPPKPKESNVVALHQALTVDADGGTADPLDIGSIVRYVTSDATVRPAIVIGFDGDLVDLNIFTAGGAKVDRSVAYDKTGEKAGTYHWSTRD